MSEKKVQTRKELRNYQILDIAGKLFAQKGFERTSTRNISEAIGVSNAGLYCYFSSKESLLFEILDNILTTGLDAVIEIGKCDKSPKEKLAAVINLYTRYYALNTINIKLLANEQEHCINSKFKQKLIKKQRAYLKVLVKILEDLKEKGEMVDIDPTIAAFTFFGMVNWIYRWYDPDGKVKPEQLADIYLKIFTKGICSGD
jgi:AcrR family transcriptional regulator